MIGRRDCLVTSGLVVAASLIPRLRWIRHAHAATTPNMPVPNPYLADSVYPISYFNPAATDSVTIAGPVNGRKLKPESLTVFTSNPTPKKIGPATIAFASGAVGVQKLLLTGKALDPVDFVAYPGFEAQAAKGHGGNHPISP